MSQSNVYAIDGTTTELHHAIRNNNQDHIDNLLKTYQADFEKFRNYLVTKYSWKEDDKVWLKKTILVAVSEVQCLAVKQLENCHLTNGQIRKAVFVLLQVSIEGEEVAVIFPEDNKLAVLSLIGQLIPNGFLSWNCCSIYWHTNFIEEAVACGNIDLIERLHNLGAEIDFPLHNALLAACNHAQKNSICWLLTNHADHLLKDIETNRALRILMRLKKVEMFEFVLDKMVVFRQKQCTESKTDAFTNIFLRDFVSGSAILKHLRKGSIRDAIEKCIAKYKLDLFRQYNGMPIIVYLLSRALALNYCFAEIRNNSSCLSIQFSETVLLHYMIGRGYVEFLEKLYVTAPDVKLNFETDFGFQQLRDEINEANSTNIQFILKHHGEFLRSDTEKFQREIVLHRYDYPQFIKNIDTICELIPEFRENYQNITGTEEKLNIRSSPNTPSDAEAYPLHKAVKAGNCELATELLDNGWDINTEDNEGNRPIHFVRNIDMLEMLLKHHTDVRAALNQTNHIGYTALQSVCCANLESSKLQLLEKIIAHGASVNHLVKNGESVIFMIENSEMLNFFLKYNANIEIVNNKGETAVLRHLFNRNADVATALLLLTHKLSSFRTHAYKYLDPIVCNDHRFFSAKYQPFLTEHPEILKALLDAVYKHSREEASRVFAVSCFSSTHFIVEKFLDFDYDLDYNCRSRFGPPLIGLLSSLHKRIDHLVQRLLQKGANVELCYQRGRNALLTAVLYFDQLKQFSHGLEVIQMLLDNGAHVDARDNNGDTALHLAFVRNEIELVELLVRNGANVNIRNNEGKIPCELGSHQFRELMNFIS
ncbi:uncharacterized protein LOC129724907 [Wyeomyia smithii]|uniref:uncharacterized protein LOC129724907 n=1 Tax=Wyeomyia smithii TaxID=174621 RepID=UPI002467E6EB|nr:uncharacterized protein LOC129724907 [Wyeomyia smithii]